jgi:SAM-dependent methyltransferase
VSACALPDDLPAGTWDVVTAFDVLEHLDAPVEALHTLRSRLSPQGQLVVTVPAYQFLWGSNDVTSQHRRRYTRRLLVEHLRAGGFEPTFTTYFNTALFPVVAAVRLAERLLRSPGSRESDVRATGALANELLTRILASERHLAAGAGLPFGVSLAAVARPG